jgi:hypothetical protein
MAEESSVLPSWVSTLHSRWLAWFGQLRAKEQEAASLLVEVMRLQEQLSAAAREHPASRSLSVLGHGARGLNNMTYATTIF